MGILGDWNNERKKAQDARNRANARTEKREAREDQKRANQEHRDATYAQTLTCGNCGTRQSVRLPKGVSVTDYAMSVVCGKCNVPNTLR